MPAFRVRDPIVLVHGILGFSEIRVGGLTVDYFRGIREALVADGNTVPVPPKLNTAGTIDERASDLRTYLETTAEVAGKPVHLIAHSMGGLDSRRLISTLQDGAPIRVRTLTTLGTPHRGTPFADQGTEALKLAIDALIAAGVDISGFFDLSTEFAAGFNAANPDADGVGYYSVAGVFEPGLLDLLKIPHDLIGESNDGLVPVWSAAYGQFLGAWPGDHFRLINWATNLVTPADELADTSIVDSYRALVGRLAEDGY